MKNKNEYYLINNPGLFLILVKIPKNSLINMMKYINNTYIKDENIKNKNTEKSFENDFSDCKKEFEDIISNKKEQRYLKKITFLFKDNKESLLHNIFLENKIIFVEGVKAWRNYGAIKNNFSCILYDEITKIDINDIFFSFQEKSNQILINMLKSKIKKICVNKDNIGSAIFCGLYFNKELNRMISVSVGNILYSILRENSRQKYEIIYISTGQYHDINVPYQLSSFNQDYNNLDVKFHNINIDDIIIIANSKQVILNFIDVINSKKDGIYNLDDLNGCNNNYLAKFKIIKGQMTILSNDNMSISSSTNSC